MKIAVDGWCYRQCELIALGDRGITALPEQISLIDIGIDVPPEKFVDIYRENPTDIVAMSALLSSTMQAMKTTIDAFSEAGIRHQTKIIVGGAPVTDDFAKEIGADGSAPDAGQAAKLAKHLVSI